MISLRCIVSGLLVISVTNAFISISPTFLPTQILVSSRSSVRSAEKNTRVPARSRICWNTLFSERDGRDLAGPINDSTSRNEFSRTIRVSKWFNGGGGGGGTGSSSSFSRQRKRMDLQIFATPEERYALANRFRLSKITALSADMVIQPAFGGGNDPSEGGNAGGQVECIEAVGTVCAQVTQKCVRSNEDFDVNLEFSFETVLRAMSSNSDKGNNNGSVDVDDAPLSVGEVSALDAALRIGNNAKQQRKNKGGDKPRGGKGITGGRQSSKDLDGAGMKQMKDILMEYEVSDEIIEDESCFCTDGIVDCGEIVAQMFRSKLDPYPKKPGSGPVSYTFTF